MSDEHKSGKDPRAAQAPITKQCHLLALPAELRLKIYNHNSTNHNGAALLEVCRTIRIEAIAECEKHLRARLAVLNERFAGTTERYLAVRARWAMGTHPIFLNGLILIRENLEQISMERYGLLNMQRQIREVWEREKAEDAYSLIVLEEKGNGGIVWVCRPR